MGVEIYVQVSKVYCLSINFGKPFAFLTFREVLMH